MHEVDTHGNEQHPAADDALRLQVCIGLTMLVGIVAGGIIARDELRRPSPPAGLATIDPNVVPWWELAALPGLGEIRSRAIVAHRDAGATAFRSPADLDRVHGIGPGTVQRVAAYLHFGQTAARHPREDGPDPVGAGSHHGPR